MSQVLQTRSTGLVYFFVHICVPRSKGYLRSRIACSDFYAVRLSYRSWLFESIRTIPARFSYFFSADLRKTLLLWNTEHNIAGKQWSELLDIIDPRECYAISITIMHTPPLASHLHRVVSTQSEKEVGGIRFQGA